MTTQPAIPSPQGGATAPYDHAPNYEQTAADVRAAQAIAKEKRAIRFNGVPLALRQFLAFGAYRVIDGKKIPMSLRGMSTFRTAARDTDATPDGERKMISVNRPGTWCSYELMNAAQRDLAEGPAFVLQESQGLVCFDIDDAETSLRKMQGFNEYDPAGQVRSISMGNKINGEMVSLAIKYGMWVERSLSGRGAHIFTFATLPKHTYSIVFGGNIFSRKRFIAMTCDMVAGSATDVTHQQEGADAIVAMLEGYGVLKASALDTNGDVIELNDVEQTQDDAVILSRMNSVNRKAVDWYNGYLEKGDWSETFRNLVGDFAKLTPSRVQAKRLISISPLVLKSPPNRGEERTAKCERLFDKTWHLAIQSNAHLKAERDAIDAENLRRFANLTIGNGSAS
jgi:hypothetical protein